MDAGVYLEHELLAIDLAARAVEIFHQRVVMGSIPAADAIHRALKRAGETVVGEGFWRGNWRGGVDPVVPTNEATSGLSGGVGLLCRSVNEILRVVFICQQGKGVPNLMLHHGRARIVDRSDGDSAARTAIFGVIYHHHSNVMLGHMRIKK